MNLHDWIDELCDALDLDVDVDETLVLDLARNVAHQVERPAAPVSTFLLGLAAGRAAAESSAADATERLEEYAERTNALASAWERPADAPDPDDVDDDVPDDAAVDHNGDVYEDAPHDRVM